MVQSLDDRDARVGDYLDDKLQTLADLDSLDALLESVRHQHTLLRKQVWLCRIPDRVF
jgi:RAD50-interacting protein 1